VHFKSHDEEFKFNCRYCENAFMSRMALAQHVKTCTSSSLVQEDTRPKSPGDKSVHLAPSPSSEASYCGRSDDEDDPFSDEYTPDNNSNNVINTSAINPPPNEEERTSGFCLRQLPSGQTRFICVRCGKHYTTNYNMRQHINIHTGKGLHACRYCKRSFTHKHVCEVRIEQ
ncbi:Zinc finger protein 62 -like protein, partial [Caligus rogercresseyi]